MIPMKMKRRIKHSSLYSMNTVDFFLLVTHDIIGPFP